MSNQSLTYILFIAVVVAILVYGRKRNKDKKAKTVPYVFTEIESKKKVNEYTRFYLEQGLEIQSANLRAKQRVISESE